MYKSIGELVAPCLGCEQTSASIARFLRDDKLKARFVDWLLSGVLQWTDQQVEHCVKFAASKFCDGQNIISIRLSSIAVELS